MIIEAGLIGAGALVSAGIAYWFGSRRTISGDAPDTVSGNLRHYHSRWKKDPDTGIYSCADCGDRYLDGKPKK